MYLSCTSSAASTRSKSCQMAGPRYRLGLELAPGIICSLLFTPGGVMEVQSYPRANEIRSALFFRGPADLPRSRGKWTTPQRGIMIHSIDTSLVAHRGGMTGRRTRCIPEIAEECRIHAIYEPAGWQGPVPSLEVPRYPFHLRVRSYKLLARVTYPRRSGIRSIRFSMELGRCS